MSTIMVPKELSDCTETELFNALTDVENDLAFSSGRGLDFFNANRKRAVIIVEAKKRGLLKDKAKKS